MIVVIRPRFAYKKFSIAFSLLLPIVAVADLLSYEPEAVNGSGFLDAYTMQVDDVDGLTLLDIREDGNLLLGIHGSGLKGIHGSGLKGIHGSGLKGIHGSGLKGIHGSGLKGIHGSGLKGIHGSGLKGIHGSGLKGIHGSGLKGIHGSGLKGIHGSGLKGIHGSGLKGIHGSGLKGTHGSGLKGIHGSGLKGIHGSGLKSVVLLEPLPVVAIGPISKVSAKSNVISVLGQNIILDDQTLTISIKNGAATPTIHKNSLNSLNEGDYIVVAGEVMDSGNSLGTILIKLATSFVDGSSPVYVRGALSSVSPTISAANSGKTEIDYSSALYEDGLFDATVGSIVEFFATHREQAIPNFMLHMAIPFQ
jgi:hypothetical protein